MILAMSERVEARTVWDGRLFSVEVVRFRHADGHWVQREVVRHPGAVIVLPVLDEMRVVMIRNYRIAPDERLWELPAGKLESGEEPIRAAGRELEEETGYAAGRIEPLGEYYTSPGFADELMRAFVATDLHEVGQRLEPGEDIEVRSVPLEEALDMTVDGRIRDGKTIATLLMWERRSRSLEKDSHRGAEHAERGHDE